MERLFKMFRDLVSDNNEEIKHNNRVEKTFVYIKIMTLISLSFMTYLMICASEFNKFIIFSVFAILSILAHKIRMDTQNEIEIMRIRLTTLAKDYRELVEYVLRRSRQENVRNTDWGESGDNGVRQEVR